LTGRKGVPSEIPLTRRLNPQQTSFDFVQATHPNSPEARELPSDVSQESTRQLDLFRESKLHAQELERQSWYTQLRREAFPLLLPQSPFSPNEGKIFNQYVEARMRISRYQTAIPEKLEIIIEHQEFDKISFEEREAISYHTSDIERQYMAAFARSDANKMKAEMAAGKNFDEAFDPVLKQLGDTARITHVLMKVPKLFRMVESKLRHLDRVAREKRLPEEIVVKTDLSEEEFRTFLFDERGQRQDTVQAGHFWVDKWFVATSLDHSNVYTSVYGPDTKTVRMYVTLPQESSGVYIRDASRHPRDEEVTLPLKTITRLDHVTYIDKSILTPEEKKRCERIPSYVVQATRVEGEWEF
jgi:hypothetical protein